MLASDSDMIFLEAAPTGSKRALALLAVPEGLTDRIASELYDLAPVDNVSADLFLTSLKYSNFTSIGRYEWRLAPLVRQKLYREAVTDAELFKKANEFLLHIAVSPSSLADRTNLPSYLLTEVGIAYHQLALGVKNSLSLYIDAFRTTRDGERWLASQLADLQQNVGLISPDAIEPAFMRGMTLYRDRHYERALEVLGQVAEIRERRWEVAVAKHLVGNSLRERSSGKALTLFRDSLSISKEIGDVENQLHVLNSYATLVRRDDTSLAIQLFEEGLRLATETADEVSRAVFLATLGNALSRDDPEKAEQLLESAIEASRRIGYQRGEASALHSLARLVRKERPAFARELVTASIDIGRRRGDKNHLAQALRTLGLIQQKDDIVQAAEALDESAQINAEMGNIKGQIIALNSLAQALVGKGNLSQAEQVYIRLAALARVGARTSSDKTHSLTQAEIEEAEEVADEAIGQILEEGQ